MAWKWKPAPVYSGAALDLGDTYYIPGTNKKGMYYSTKLDNDDYDRAYYQTSGNIDYIARPYSQSDWKPNVTKPQATKNSKAPTTGKPRTSASSTTSKPRTGRSKTMSAPKTPTSNSWINRSRGIWNYN